MSDICLIGRKPSYVLLSKTVKQLWTSTRTPVKQIPSGVQAGAVKVNKRPVRGESRDRRPLFTCYFCQNDNTAGRPTQVIIGKNWNRVCPSETKSQKEEEKTPPCPLIHGAHTQFSTEAVITEMEPGKQKPQFQIKMHEHLLLLWGHFTWLYSQTHMSSPLCMTEHDCPVPKLNEVNKKQKLGGWNHM